MLERCRLTHAAISRHHRELRSRHLIHRLPIAQMVGADVVSGRIAAVMPADAPHLGMRQTAQHREMLAVRLQRLEILGKLKETSSTPDLDGHAKGKIRDAATGLAAAMQFSASAAPAPRRKVRRSSRQDWVEILLMTWLMILFGSKHLAGHDGFHQRILRLSFLNCFVNRRTVRGKFKRTPQTVGEQFTTSARAN